MIHHRTWSKGKALDCRALINCIDSPSYYRALLNCIDSPSYMVSVWLIQSSQTNISLKLLILSIFGHFIYVATFYHCFLSAMFCQLIRGQEIMEQITYLQFICIPHTHILTEGDNEVYRNINSHLLCCGIDIW